MLAESQFPEQIFCATANAFQQFAILPVIDQGNQPVTNFQTQHIHWHDVRPAGLNTFHRLSSCLLRRRSSSLFNSLTGD
jgi:hypothetical protein